MVVLFSSSERAQSGVVRVTSPALPSASVRRVTVKPFPVMVTVTPSTGLDWRAAKAWMRKIPVAMLMLSFV